MRTLPAVLTFGLALASLAYAEPLDTKQVAADVRWFVHIDVDAIKAGQIPQTVGSLVLNSPASGRELKRLAEVAGLNLPEDLHGITIYGRRYAEPATVVIVYAKVDQQRLTAFLQQKPGYHTDSYGKHELIVWTEMRGRKDEHTVTGCFYRAGMIVFGRDAAEVKRALDVLDGTSPSLPNDDPLLAAETPRGTMIQARGVDLYDVELPFKSPLVRKSKSFRVALGEHNGEAFAVARATTESVETAKQLRAVVEGLLAMAELQFESDEQISQLLEAVKISSEGKSVTVELRGPVEDGTELIKKAWKDSLKLE